MIAFLENLQGSRWIQYGEYMVKVIEEIILLEVIDYNRVGHYEPFRISIIRDGASCILATADHIRELKIQRNIIYKISVLVTIFVAIDPE